MIEVTCPSCRGRFSADTSSGYHQFQCPHCASPVTLQGASPVPVAKPLVAPVTANSGGTKTLLVVLGIVGVSLGLLIAVVGGIVFYRYAAVGPVADVAAIERPSEARPSIPKPTPVERAEPVERNAPVRSPSTRPPTSPTPSLKTPSSKPPAVSTPKRAPEVRPEMSPPNDPFGSMADKGPEPQVEPAAEPTKQANPVDPVRPDRKVRIGDPIRYRMTAGSRYNYRLTLKANVDDRLDEIFGSLSYTVSDKDPRKFTRLQRRDLFDDQKFDGSIPLTLVDFSGNASAMSGMGGGNNIYVRGQTVFDEFGKLVGSKKEPEPFQPAENSSMVKYLFDPLERLPLVEFPSNGQTSWTEKRSFKLTVAHAESSRNSLNYPRLYSVAPRSRPYGTKTTTLDVKQLATYEIEREDDEVVLISRVIEGKPDEKDGLSVSFERTEEIKFDKQRKVVQSIECKGAITLSKKNLSLKIPFTYELELNEILSADELAKKEAARKARAARVAKLRENEAVPTGKHVAELRRNALDAYAKLKYTQPLSDVKNSQSIIWSPDSRFLICNSRSGNVNVLDVLRDEIVFSSRSFSGLKAPMAVSNDGKTFCVSDRSGTIFVMNILDDGKLKERAQLNTRPDLDGEVSSIAIDPSGRYLMAGFKSKAAGLWDLETKELLVNSDQFKYDVKAVGFTDGGKTALACGSENAVYIDVANKKVKEFVETYREHTATAMALSRDGQQLVISEGSKVGLYDTSDMRRKATLDVDDSVTWKVGFMPDGKHVILGSKGLSIWNTRTREHVAELKPSENSYVQIFDTSPDGQFIATSVSNLTPEVVVNPLLSAVKKTELMATAGMVMGDNGKLRKGEVNCKLAFPGYQAKATAFSKDNRFLFVSGGETAVFDLKTKKRVQKIERFRDEGQVNVMAATDDGSKLLIGTYSGKVLIFDVASDGKLTQGESYIGHSQSVQAITIGPKSKLVVSGEQKRVRIWDLKSTRELGSIEMEDGVKACRIIQDGKTAVVTDGRLIKTISLKNMKVLREVKVEGYHSSCDLTIDGKYLIVGDYKTTKLIDTKTGTETRTIARSTGSQTWVVLSDNEHVVVAKHDSTEIINLKTGQVAAKLKSKGLRAEAISSSSDGLLIAAPSSSNELLVLNSPLVD